MFSKLSRSLSLLLVLSFFFSGDSFSQSARKKKYVINGYVGGYRGTPVNIDEIDANKLTHINYAFVNCIDSMAVLSNLKTDTVNFRLLNQLKKINPDLQILISIGGWTWSKNFSDAVLTPTSRLLFAKTSVNILRQHNLDGVDIDWEYPGQRGDNNKFRPEDKVNFTLMFVELRKELDNLSTETGKKYLLTAALGASKNFIANTEMDKVAKLLDYLYLMTYDFGGPNGTVGHHTNLYSYGQGGTSSSADQAIQDFIAAGVPAHKLGIGVAFYGKAVDAAGVENNGLGQERVRPIAGTPSASSGQAGGYTKLKESVINQNGYTRYWDKQAQAPYLFNPDKKVFITYDDEKSTKLKAKYVKKHKLAGVFFWEYFSDPEENLLNVLDKTLN
ncbi:glycoside hydrolase family 18 protein [Daejeonella sp.]|uniref:glycoside hydrolase family 18 protein n=1 Tax=Daejeonella sp. TaxID=2805397 RepID=UPI003983C613